MAWDMAFNIQWSQRIEKEERAFLAGNKRAAELHASSGSKAAGTGGDESPSKGRHSKRSNRGSRPASCSSSSPLKAAGSAATLPKSPSASALEARSTSSAHSRRSKGSTDQLSSESYLADIPDHLRPISRFPVVDKDLMTARVKRDPSGKVPTIAFHGEEIPALWWPGRGHYTKYHPEFKFEDPPAWIPEDILQDRKTGRRL